jgi:transportin-1
VFARCLKLIATTLEENHLAHERPDLMMDPPDAEFIVAALDLLSGMVQGMNTLVTPLVNDSHPPLYTLIDMCLKVSILET